MASQIAELNEKVTSYLSRPPPAPAFPEDISTFIESLKPAYLVAVREELKPLLADIRSNVAEMLRTQNEEFANTLLSKVHLTLQMIETLSNWAGNLKPDPDAVNHHHDVRGAMS